MSYNERILEELIKLIIQKWKAPLYDSHQSGLSKLSVLVFELVDILLNSYDRNIVITKWSGEAALISFTNCKCEF